MEESIEKSNELERQNREEIHSTAIRAGKRTYFFDVRTTRRNDYYLTITESKKRFDRDGRFYYEKHKIFLYNEDFEKFLEGLNEALEFVHEVKPDDLIENYKGEEDEFDEKFSDVEFEDLDRKLD